MSRRELGCWPPPRLVREVRALLSVYLRGRAVDEHTAEKMIDFGVWLFQFSRLWEGHHDLP